MKLCIIGPGVKEIPPKAWGAIESLIWDYYLNLKKKNIDVDLINNRHLKQVITEINKKAYDIVHIMYDDYVVIAPYINCGKIIYTSHYAYITHPDFQVKYSSYFNNIFKNVILNKNFITINAISNEIKQVYVKHGFPENKINVIQNGAREDMFIFHQNPEKINKSIYLAKIEERKKQYKYQNIKNIDFVGNYSSSNFDRTNKNYLGEWDKDTLYKNMSHYGNLILLSDGEADPLVVKEALICGLGVVISECSAANLDEKEFITIIPNDKLNDIDYITRKIIKNRIISLSKRNEIREYALNKFSWNNIINKYLDDNKLKNSKIDKITAVTALFDIKRENEGDGRSISNYVKWLNLTLKLNIPFVIYCDSHVYEKIKDNDIIKNKNKYKIIVLNHSEIEYFKYIDTVKKIVKDEKYISKMKGKSRLEIKLPIYNLLIMNKINFMNMATENDYFKSNFYLWIDAGCSRFFDNNNLNSNKLWPNFHKLKYDKFNIQIKKTIFQINDINEILYHNDHFTTATIFGGNKEILKLMKQYVYNTFQYMIKNNIINNEQIVFAVIYKKYPDLFETFINKTNEHLPYFRYLTN